MGFGSILSLNIEFVPGLLNYYILDNYDPQQNVLENVLIEITPELAYVAILEHAYDKILTEKNNMEVALQEGLAKHPDCPELIE
ncbi:hypothetical protein L1887_12071 [Cichorium endivia]|nr:hypothetical protein L1887_12071 [Cichorium endivia]